MSVLAWIGSINKSWMMKDKPLFVPGQLNPGGRMITGFLPTSDLPIHPGSRQAAGDGRTEQQVIDTQAGISAIRVPEIIPEGVDTLAWMPCAQRIGPPLSEQTVIGSAHFWSE